MTSNILIYQTLLKEIKNAQTKVFNSVNIEMMLLYYKIGKALHQKQEKEGWGRDTLIQKIKQEVHKKEGKLISNFKAILPPINSELVQQSFKDPYLFDFITMAEPFRERELELNLVKHMENFLLELGSGFAFVGRQYHLEVSDKDFYIDLLFYHLKLRSYVVIELKKRRV